MNAQNNETLLIPKRITVETVFGCNLSCTMCDIDAPTERKKRAMPFELYAKYVIDPLVPYKDVIETIDLFGLGEPLIDRLLFKRIRYAKAQGFRNVGISTNADMMPPGKRYQLLESGIDNVIISIDGASKATHERIRRGSLFERTVGNTLALINERNQGNYPARIVLRFIRQEENWREWDAFKTFWALKINRSKNDIIACYDVHAQGPVVGKSQALIQIGSSRTDEIEREACPIISNIIHILADGTVTLCSQDWLHARYNFGNVKDKSPIELFNAPQFKEIRSLHSAGNKNQMAICSGCTIAYSEKTKQFA